MKNKENLWEKRAQHFGNQKSAVMRKNNPLIRNYSHQFEVEAVTANLPSKKCLCLDVGCGYGRMAMELIAKNPSAFIYGVDIAPTFVRLFNRQLKNRGQALLANARHLPFPDKKFDFVYLISVLAFIKKKSDRQRVIQEIFRVLKPGCRVVIIETSSRGEKIAKIGGLLTFLYRLIKGSKNDYHIPSFPLAWNEIDKMITHSDARIFSKKGLPFFTLFFPFLGFFEKTVPILATPFLPLLRKLDKIFPSPLFSYYLIYVLEKRE